MYWKSSEERTAVGTILRHAPAADILVNNAGIIRRNALLDYTGVDSDAVIEVNLRSIFALSRDFARRLWERNQGGRIINVASMLSFQGGLRVAAYTDNTQALRDEPQRSREILCRMPPGRWGVPDDLKGAVVFLASAASAYVHGTVIPVDGGWLAR